MLVVGPTHAVAVAGRSGGEVVEERVSEFQILDGIETFIQNRSGRRGPSTQC